VAVFPVVVPNPIAGLASHPSSATKAAAIERQVTMETTVIHQQSERDPVGLGRRQGLSTRDRTRQPGGRRRKLDRNSGKRKRKVQYFLAIRCYFLMHRRLHAPYKLMHLLGVQNRYDIVRGTTKYL
jgi:hypothetical protein